MLSPASMHLLDIGWEPRPLFKRRNIKSSSRSQARKTSRALFLSSHSTLLSVAAGEERKRKESKAAGLSQSGDLQLKSVVAVAHRPNLSRIPSQCSGCVNTAGGTFKSTDASRPLGCVKVKYPRDALAAAAAPAAAVMSSTAASSPAATWQRLAIIRRSRRPSGATRAVL